MIVREAKFEDLAALATLGAATFAGNFQHLYSAENLSSFLKANHSQAYYREAILDPTIKIWLVEHQGNLVAYCKIGPNGLPCEPPRPNALELSRIYVLDEFRNQGLGQRLMDVIIDYAIMEGAPEIVLSVYAKNYEGQRFYQRFGFTQIGEYGFRVGNHIDPEFIYMKPLKPS